MDQWEWYASNVSATLLSCFQCQTDELCNWCVRAEALGAWSGHSFFSQSCTASLSPVVNDLNINMITFILHQNNNLRTASRKYTCFFHLCAIIVGIRPTLCPHVSRIIFPPPHIFTLINFNAVSLWKTQYNFPWLTSFLLMSHHKPNVLCSHSNAMTLLGESVFFVC